MFPFFVFAYTKEDIIKMVDNQKLSDQETENLYNKYFSLYSRLLETRELDSETIDVIYENVSSALDVIKEYDIKSIDDLDKIPKKKKDELYDTLYDTSKIIIKAPSANGGKTTIKYNDDDTIDIYEDGEHLDKIYLKRSTFNYVGLSSYFVQFKYILPTSLIILIVLLFITKKKEILNNIVIILFTLILIANVFYFSVGTNAFAVYNLVKSMNTNEKETINSIQVVDKKVVKNPSYASKIGSLIIDSLDINLSIYYGESKEVLKKGIGYTGAFPGFNGTTILSGHNSELFLNNLKNIKIDDIITINTDYGVFKYKVVKMEIKNENEYSSLEKEDKRLIIYTCYPFDEIVYSNQRFVIYADLIEEKWSDV